MHALILAGGSGSRLWPLSRPNFPKQFLNLHGKNTMLQETIIRLSELPIVSTTVICNEDHRFLVAEQLRNIDKLEKIILEPEPKNTAPAITLGTLNLSEEDILLVLPADHVIENNDQFTEAINKAIPLAEEGNLITFGINPTEPHTGYGYIKKGREKGNGFIVEEFKEKPNLMLAQEYITSGEFLWNSGIFLFKAGIFLNELMTYSPDTYRTCKLALENSNKDLEFTCLDKEIFSSCVSESVDYAVMEKTSLATVVPLDAGWNDLGSWGSLFEISKKDEDGNSTKGDAIFMDSTNNYVNTDNKLVTLMGVDDLVIIVSQDVCFVSHKGKDQDVKALIAQLETAGRKEGQFSKEVHRPWGKYNSIDQGDRYQVKRITVKPYSKLSLQKHKHRSEHWVVVSGTARITNGKDVFEMVENESTYIPAGVIHCLENPTDKDLEIIEVQSGDYLERMILFA